MGSARSAERDGSTRVLAVLLPLACWAVYAPLGVKYLAWMLLTGASALAVHRRPDGWRRLLDPASAIVLALSTWMLASAFWSPADWGSILAHGWMYLLPLSTVLIAAACPASLAWRSLHHFVAASALVGALWFLHAHGLLHDSKLLSSTVTAQGNQRIASSLLLAVGAALGLWLAAQPERSALPRGLPPVLMRVLLSGAALLAALGLAWQDRRSGMLLLPLLLLAWALSAPRSWHLKAALMGVVLLGAGGVWLASDGVRARFAEGRAELQAYSQDGVVASSWGQRVRMVEQTVQMVREQPLHGHGLGSWVTLWTERMQPGTRLSGNSTPHNEYLLVAAQAGLPALLLLVLWLLLMLRRAWHAGPSGTPALMLWLTLAAVGVANAALRDAKFALPLLCLAGVASALQAPQTGRSFTPAHH